MADSKEKKKYTPPAVLLEVDTGKLYKLLDCEKNAVLKLHAAISMQMELESKR